MKMRVLVLDTDGRPLVNTTINIASELPDPAFSFQEESNCAIAADHQQQQQQQQGAFHRPEPDYFLSKIQIVLSYLGTACLARLVERLNAAFRDPRYHRSVMEEQALASELASALTSINNAYQRIKPYSTSGANALAKISVDLGKAYNKCREGDGDPFAELAADTSSLKALPSQEIPQPEGLGRTFWRQRPKENWVQTVLRVFSENGVYSLEELRLTNTNTAKLAAGHTLRMKEAALSNFDVDVLKETADHHPASFDTPLSSKPTALREKPNLNLFAQARALYGDCALFSPPSPLNAEATPFTPGGGHPLFGPVDELGKQGHRASKEPSPPSLDSYGQSALGRRPQQALGLRVLTGNKDLAHPVRHQFPFPLGSGPQPVKKMDFAPIGHERARAVKLRNQSPEHSQPAPQVQRPRQALDSLPDTWEDELSPDDEYERFPGFNKPVRSFEEGEHPTSHTSDAPDRDSSPQFEVNGPDSPTYKTWAQKAAENGDVDGGWEKVEKGRKAGHNIALRDVGTPQSISHKSARYVIVSGCRAGTTLTDITSEIDTGPLVSITLEKSPDHAGIDARILFIYGSHAVDFVQNDMYNRQREDQSLFGPGVSVVLGPGYEGPAGDLKGLTVALNQVGRSDAGAHFARRRLTFSGNSLAMTDVKMRNMLLKHVGIDPSEIELVHVFNPGNATAILSSIFAARKVMKKLNGKGGGEWRHCKVMYSSDPCEKHLPFMDKIKKQDQADRAEVVRRAYQKAGKVTC